MYYFVGCFVMIHGAAIAMCSLARRLQRWIDPIVVRPCFLNLQHTQVCLRRFEMADVVSNLKYIYTSHAHEDYTMSSTYGLRSICSAIRILTTQFSAHAVRMICWPRDEPGVTSPGHTSAMDGGWLFIGSQRFMVLPHLFDTGRDRNAWQWVVTMATRQSNYGGNQTSHENKDNYSSQGKNHANDAGRCKNASVF